ncbi:MAG: shikimate dehydrogenase [Magnetococcales bacterium]|nr:shikimate dehydrogenase [Magnetococcales bacterium]MBF0421336.1 shikimate dehydrogenase [Magnetococcales bacterium]
MGSGGTRLLGIFGDPIAHSLSPVIHNLSCNLLGLDYRYLPFHVPPERLSSALQSFRNLGGVGFNATIPHKEALLPLMDELTPAARRIGAVNTVICQERLIGHNTDAYGFLAALREVRPDLPDGHHVLVLGAGGAARSVVSALLDTGCQTLILANRTRSRAEALAQFFAPHDPGHRIQAMSLDVDRLPWETITLLVNTTSLGIHGEASLPVAWHRLPDDAFVYDIVYGPRGTPLTRLALSYHRQTMDGLDMLIHQAAAAFTLWTNREMPVATVRSFLSRSRDGHTLDGGGALLG